MKRRSRSCDARTSDARKRPPATEQPRRRRSPRTRRAPPSEESIPPTFSMSIHQAPDWTKMRRAAPQRSRGSSRPRRLPARLWGWHGMPPTTPSTPPRRRRPGTVRTSLQIGAGAMMPWRICATSPATAKASLSTHRIGRALGIASSTARSRPPPPVQRETYPRPDRALGCRATFKPPPLTCAPKDRPSRPQPPGSPKAPRHDRVRRRHGFRSRIGTSRSGCRHRLDGHIRRA